MKLTLIVCIYLILFASCKKEAASSFDPNFEGEWHSIRIETPTGLHLENYIVIIDDHGNYCEACIVEQFGGEVNSGNVFSGPAVIDRKGTRFQIGSPKNGNVRINFDIEQLPFLNTDGIWQCRLTSRDYFKEP